MLMQGIPFSYSNDICCRRVISKGYAYTFFSLLIKEVGLCDLQSSKTSLLAQDILNYLQANYLEPITLDTLCNEFGYSRSSFSHIFNNYFGCSLTKYLNILRCLHFNDSEQKQEEVKEEGAEEVAKEVKVVDSQTFGKLYKGVVRKEGFAAGKALIEKMRQEGTLPAGY